MLEVVEQICAEFGFDGRVETPAWGSVAASRGVPMGSVLTPEDEHLIAAVKAALAKLAAAASASRRDEVAESAVGIALAGVELVMRGEIVSGKTRLVRSLMPGFIFMVSLPLVDQDMALALSGRADELIEQAFRS